MKKLAALAKGAVRILNRGRLMHYLDYFAAAFVVALVANKQHILGAHGYDAWKSAVEAASVVAGKATLELYRKSTPLPTSLQQFLADQGRAQAPPK